MAGIFGKADFTKESNAKQSIYQKMMESKQDSHIISYTHELSDDELYYVAAAGSTDSETGKKNPDLQRDQTGYIR